MNVRDVFSWLWVGWALYFAVLESLAIHDGDKPSFARTLSANLRAWFHTDTVYGRTVWAMVAGLFFGWFLIHIAMKPGSVF